MSKLPFAIITTGVVIVAMMVLWAALYFGRKSYRSAPEHAQRWWGLQVFSLLFSVGCFAFGGAIATQAWPLGNLILAFMLLGTSVFMWVMIKQDIAVIAQLTRIAALEKHRAVHDELTRLPNRVSFSRYLDEMILRLDRSQPCQLAVLMLDLRRLKTVNDILGHRFGDLLLQEIALRLHRALRKTDMLARMGGDEFGVLLDLKADPSHLGTICRHIVEALEEPFAVEGWPADVGMHIGVAWYPKDGIQGKELMNHARLAMRHATQSNLDMVEYSRSLDTLGPHRLNIISELSHAIKQNDLVVHYQPQFDLRQGWICGVEALIRWPHLRLGLLSPDEFIPLAEENGLITRLSFWVLDIVLDQLKAWQAMGIALPISTNISATSLEDEEFHRYILDGIHSRQLMASQLKLEITETVVLANHGQASRIVHQLARSDIQFAIDDFGTGYSSLQYLKNLPAKEIKIDKSFVLGVSKDNENAMIIRSTIDLAHKLGCLVTAEGVESAETLELLKKWACDRAQGFYFGQPMAIEELNQRLHRNGSESVNPWTMQPNS
jgi:diguanylate cyclase (GGDEF)-like protein